MAMHCPNCGSEYREGYRTCTDCDVALISGTPLPIPQSAKDLARHTSQRGPQGRYSVAWEDYARRRNAFAGALGAYLIASLCLLWLTARFNLHLRHGFVGLLFALATVGGIAIMALSGWAVYWPCPRCGKPFHKSRFRNTLDADRCRHCGLPKWATDDPDLSNSPRALGPPDSERAVPIPRQRGLRG